VNDPATYWLSFMNIALGVVVLICCAAVAVGIFQELAARHRRHVAAAQLDQEWAHMFQVPGLGVTMADGGEELTEKDKR
jgi:ABC-type lipoprotein release transport system permease subunit